MNHNNDNHAAATQPFSADDPRLTAYALGEMDAPERAAFEAELRDNPAAQSAIADIRALTGQIETALAAEPAPETERGTAPAFDEDWRAAREAEAREAKKRARKNKPFRFPYFLVSGLATACFAVLFFTVIKPAHNSGHQHPAPTETKPELAVVQLDRFVVTQERTGQAKVLMEQRAADKVVTAVNIDTFGDLSSGSIGEFLKNTPGITIHYPEDTASTIRVSGLDPKYAGFSMEGISLASGYGSSNTRTWASASADTRAFEIPGSESYARHADNTFQRVTENPLSTFSADIDTASYTNIRRIINAGSLPPRDAVRIEEMVNYFSYDYAPPAKDSAAPFAATMEVAAAPWNPEHRLVRIGIKGREVDDAARPPANLVFLLDISGSMDAPNRLPLVKESMRMLVNRLRAGDRIAIVTYAETIDLALPSTPLGEKTKILEALDALRPRGGTNGGKGIQLAYEIAKANFIKDGANRVILCTDGDFNIGLTSRDALTALIEEKAKSGVFLTVLGFGMGNLKDSTLQLLADKGNGNHGYIDTREEARRLLVEQTAGTLVTIAKDVKLQVEFNPAQAESYRLIGYEKRLLAKEDFNNDKVDAGEIGAGHTVTALYEVVPAKTKSAAAASRDDSRPAISVDPLKYQTQTTVTTPAPKVELKGELLTLKIRYKAPSSDMSDKVEFVLEDKGAAFAEASPDFKFTCSVAAFGMILRNSADKGLATCDSVIGWAESGINAAAGTERDRRAEFTDLVRRAKQQVAN